MTRRGPGPATVAAILAAAALALAACGGDDEPVRSPAERTTYVDDRGPAAVTAAATPGPGGQYADPIVDGNVAQQAEEVVRDYQESLAVGAAGDACRELRPAVRARLGPSCTRAVAAAIAARGSDGYRPSKILAVRVPSLDTARVTVQDGRRAPFAIVLAGREEGGWALTDVDLDRPSGLRRARR